MKMAKLNNKLRKAFHGRSRGFTLVEVLITIALIGAVGVAFMTAMSAISSALIRADQRTIAESLARSQMEFVKSQPYDPYDPQSYEQPDVESIDHPGYFISVSAEPLHYPDDGIQKITVIVSRYGQAVITLEGYKGRL